MRSWLSQHGNSAALAWRRLVATPVNSLLFLLAVGVALALPAGGQMLLANVLQFARGAGNVNAAPQISLFLSLDADRKSVAGVAARLKNHAGVKEFRFVSRDQALKRMQASEGLAEVIAALPTNPFPDAFVVMPRDESPAGTENIREEFSRWANVDRVQLDSTWVRRLDAMLRLGRTGVALLAVLLGVGLVAITFTTIRLQVLTQRAEIEVSRLLGATDSFIRRPFYYFGLLHGLAGGAVAWLIVLGVTGVLSGPVAEVARFYNANVILSPLASIDVLLLFGLAGGLGWLGAALSLGQYLRDSN